MAFDREARAMWLFPAPAGVILGTSAYLGDVNSVPRTRGGDPRMGSYKKFMKGCSPHPRG